MTRLRSKRQPDAELARARADGESENASDADQGNGKGDGGEDAEHNCVETIRGENFGANVFEGGGAFHGLVDGHAANELRDWRDERIRICAGVDEEPTAKHWTLFKGIVDSEARARNDVLVVYIGSDANDAVRRSANAWDEFHHGIRPIDMPIDGILIGEHALSESLTDDNDRIFTLAVELIEITAFDNGNAERGKKSGRDGAQLSARIFFAGGTDVAIRRKLKAGAKAAGITPGHDNAESGLGYTG